MLSGICPNSSKITKQNNCQGGSAIKAYRWLGHDGYEYLFSCNKEEAFHIIAHFGPGAKAVAFPISERKKGSLYFLNTRDKILTPVRYLSFLGAHADEDCIVEECSVAVFLDDYRFAEYPF